MDQEEIRNVVEAALFAAEMPLSMRRLLDLFDGGDGQLRSDLDTVLASLTDEYKDRGIELVQVAEGYRFQTREQYAPWLRRMHGTRSPRYSKALLETLAIIAYRQPVTRGDIEEVRGVSVTTDIMRTLLDREWVSQKGVREVPGRPALYVTSSKFLEYFGLMRLADLPVLGEQRQLNEIARELGIILPPVERDVVAVDTDVGRQADHVRVGQQYLGQALLALGQPELAVEMYEKLVELLPWDERAKRQLMKARKRASRAPPGAY